MDKEAIIKKKVKKLNELFKGVEPNKKELLQELIGNCAFMESQLKEMQDILNSDTITKTERKETVQQYNSLSKNYLACIGKLLNELPPDVVEDELDRFLKGR